MRSSLTTDTMTVDATSTRTTSTRTGSTDALATTPVAAPATRSPWAAVAARLDEASTWAGIGGILLVVLDLMPGALPAFHAALGQHGWAKTAGLLAAVLSFTVAVARREGCTTIAEIAQAAAVVVETEKCRGATAVVSTSRGAPPVFADAGDQVA